MGCGLALFSPFVLAGLFILIFTGATWLDWIRFSADARQTMAVVIGKTVDNTGDDTAYFIEYRYVTPEDRSFDGRVSLSHEHYNDLIEGQRVAVEYMGGDPSSSRLADENHLAMPLFLTAFSLIWNGFIGVVLTSLVRGVRRARWMRDEGRLVPAEILSYTAATDSDNDLVVTGEYRLITPEGLAISGRYKSVRNDLKGAPLPTCPLLAAALYIDERTHDLL